MDLPTVTPRDIHQHDLVSFGVGLSNRGVVEGEGTPVDNFCTFKILRLDNSVVTRKASDLTVIDRSYLNIAHVVASAADVGGQIGVVTGATTVLDLVKLDERGEVVEAVNSVPSSRLRRVRALGLGDLVVSGPWLGQVFDVRVDVDVSFDDGAVCRVADAEYTMLQPVSETNNIYYLPQKNSCFSPGQRVESDKRGSTVFKDARWLRGAWNADRDVAIGTVVKVEMSAVLVHWIASTHCGTDRQLVDAYAPPTYQHPDDLTFFWVAYNNYGWGPPDRCFFTVGNSTFAHDRHLEEEEKHDTCSDDDDHQDINDDNGVAVAHNKDEEAAEGGIPSGKCHLQGTSTGAAQRSRDNVELPMTVANTRTYVDVLWQDGTRQHGIPSQSVVPFNIINEQEFLPGYHVVDNASLDGATAGTINDDITSDGTNPTRRVGVVRTVCCKDQTVNVSWFKAAACPNEAREVECNDTVSAYNLQIDPGDTPDLGDTVVRLLPSRSSDGGTSVQSGSTTKKNVARADLSWVGYVIDLPDGHVQVKWGDGSISTVLPHEIVVAYEENYMGRKGEIDEDIGSDASEESTAADTDNDESDNSEANEDVPSARITGRLSSFVWSLLRLAGGVLAQVKGFVAICPPSWFLSSELPTSTEENLGEPTNTSEEGKKSRYAAGEGRSFCFSRFDVLQSPPDHHYLDIADKGGCRGKSWTKTVQKEWKILQNNLPETIYVRAFEDRMDLLRAVIIGASGTPYQDGLFFFDLQLPPSYLAVPPHVYYHSFGLRLNPNLYESGTVCLSLLNTFHGEGTEVWLPTTSSLLQVLVSIQGLILNDQPYYNEAGYETLVGTPAGLRNALPYGENAYLLNLRTMLHLLRRPPQGFEGFIKNHFSRRGRFVLRTCEAYLRGVDGMPTEDGNATVAGRERPCSAGLKLALANVIPNLVAAFTEIGVDGCTGGKRVFSPGSVEPLVPVPEPGLANRD